jgi:hypothetical protein
MYASFEMGLLLGGQKWVAVLIALIMLEWSYGNDSQA